MKTTIFTDIKDDKQQHRIMRCVRSSYHCGIQNNIVYFFKAAMGCSDSAPPKNERYAEFIDAFNRIKEKIDQTDIRYAADMNMFGGNGKIKQDFFRDVNQFIKDSKTDDVVKFIGYMYAACSKSSMYTHIGVAESQGKTFNQFMKESEYIINKPIRGPQVSQVINEDSDSSDDMSYQEDSEAFKL